MQQALTPVIHPHIQRAVETVAIKILARGPRKIDLAGAAGAAAWFRLDRAIPGMVVETEAGARLPSAVDVKGGIVTADISSVVGRPARLGLAIRDPADGRRSRVVYILVGSPGVTPPAAPPANKLEAAAVAIDAWGPHKVARAGGERRRRRLVQVGGGPARHGG